MFLPRMLLVLSMSQYDLPPQASLQQSSARAVSGEELETYGKHASTLYHSGVAANLNAAVVDTIKSAGLAPEQVRRVVEFANTAAFQSEFQKEGASTKYVVFDGGPAEYNTVLQDLNDGGGGTVFDRGTLDYTHMPTMKTASRGGMDKTAAVSARADDILAEAFAVPVRAAPIPFAHPLAEVHAVRDKLSGVRDTITHEINALEVDLLAISEDMYRQVKQAALEGVPLGHILQAWDSTLRVEPELVKAAFAFMGPRLHDEGIFATIDAVGASLEKTAELRAIVNPEHPLIAYFDAYQGTVTKLASLRAAREEAMQGIDQLLAFERSVATHYKEVSQ